MQTRFTSAQLADPRTAESERALRQCVHCGFCTATCPTYVLLGDELDSPRGRIYLIKDTLENDRPATPELVTHIDRCLSCLACVTTCPSGVDYRHLVEHARAHIERTAQRPAGDRALRRFIEAVLPHPTRFRLLLRLAPLGRALAPLLPRRLRHLLALAPRDLPRAWPQRREVHAATSPRRMRVALLTGCAQSVLTPQVHAAAIRLLTRLGAEVVTLPGCCGALVHHLGREPEGRGVAEPLLRSLGEELDGEGLDAVVTDASGCGLHVKDYAHVYRDDPQRAALGARIGTLARDVTEVIASLGIPARPRGAPPLPLVAYQSACSLQHGQRLDALPRELLQAAGYPLAPVAENHLCCGSAGSYNLLQPDIAERLRARKLANLRASGAALVATGNVGCAMQLASSEGPPIRHTVELLEEATRPAP